jgi:hypothetical protein
MALPVSGAKTKNVFKSDGTYIIERLVRIWRTQAKPYNLRLPFDMESSRQLSRKTVSGGYGAPPYDAGQAPYTYDNRERVSTQLAAYEALKGQLSSANLAVTIAERQQAMAMIAQRLTQISGFLRNLRKGDISAAARALGYESKQPRRNGKPRDSRLKEYRSAAKRGSKNLAGNYLEFHFGWAPLVADIYGATQVLSAPIKSTRVRGKGTTVERIDLTYPGTNLRYKYDIQCGCQLISDVYISNPNLYLTTQLGLTNPAVVAWELVPFSFVVDWFVNVGQFLASFTDFHGLTLVSPATTYRQDCTYYHMNDYGDSVTVRKVKVLRQGGIDAPPIQLRPLQVFGVRRALAAVSLVVQQLTNIK